MSSQKRDLTFREDLFTDATYKISSSDHQNEKTRPKQMKKRTMLISRQIWFDFGQMQIKSLESQFTDFLTKTVSWKSNGPGFN
jgi:hypothetical protein